MTDADLIYNALLRAERKAEVERDSWPIGSSGRPLAAAVLEAVRAIRHEVGAGLAERPMKIVPHAKETVDE